MYATAAGRIATDSFVALATCEGVLVGAWEGPSLTDLPRTRHPILTTADT
jgi:hypothetical protein